MVDDEADAASDVDGTESTPAASEPEAPVQGQEGASAVDQDEDQSAEQAQLLRLEKRFSGPLPPPWILSRYEQVLPGAAERILGLTERQSEHRQDLEDRALRSNTESARRGQWFAFLLGLAGLAAAVYLIASGNTTPGLVIFFSDFFALAGAFVWGQISAQKELRQKSSSGTSESRNSESKQTSEQQELPLQNARQE